MKRLPDWDRRLADYLRGCRDRTYHPALFNCGTFVAGAIAAQTGEEIVGRYSLDDGSYSSFCHDMAARFGLLEVGPLSAMRGDPIASPPAPDTDLDISLGICVGAQGMFLHPDGRFLYRNIDSCLMAWRI